MYWKCINMKKKKFSPVELCILSLFVTYGIIIWNNLTARCPICENPLDNGQWYVWDTLGGKTVALPVLEAGSWAYFPYEPKDVLYCDKHRPDMLPRFVFIQEEETYQVIFDLPRNEIRKFPDMGFELALWASDYDESWIVQLHELT